MGKSRWEDPEVALTDVPDKHRAIRVHERDASLAIENIGPFVGSMPVQLAKASRRESHVDAGYILRRRKKLLGHLVRPSSLLDSLFCQIEGIPDWTNISVVGRRRVIGVGVLLEENLVFLARIAVGIVVLGFLSVYL